MANVAVVDGRVRVGPRWVDLEGRAATAAGWTGGHLVILLDCDQRSSRSSQYRNLIAFDSDLRLAWIATLPTSWSGDCYTEVGSFVPLSVFSFSSYRVHIDGETGQIIAKEFLK